MAKRNLRKSFSAINSLAILDIAEILVEVPKEEWEFVLNHAKTSADARLVLETLRDLYKKL